jgi:Yip1-like protein
MLGSPRMDVSALQRGESGGGRLRRAAAVLLAPLRPFLAILFPDRVPAEVDAQRYGWPFLLLIVCASLSAFAIGSRLDLGPEVRARNSGAPQQANPAAAEEHPEEVKTDREIDEQIVKETAVARVMLGLKAVFVTPLQVLAFGVALLLLGRYIRGTPTMGRAVTAAALGSLPGGVRALVTGIAAWKQTSVGSDTDTLVDAFSPAAALGAAGHPVLQRLLTGVDLFTVWAFVVVWLGFSAATGVKRSKGFVAILVGFVLYLLVTRLIMAGGEPPPGAMPGPGSGPGVVG